MFSADQQAETARYRKLTQKNAVIPLQHYIDEFSDFGYGTTSCGSDCKLTQLDDTCNITLSFILVFNERIFSAKFIADHMKGQNIPVSVPTVEYIGYLKEA